MKKIRITILLSILIGIVILWIINPEKIQDWIFGAIGEKGQTYLMEALGREHLQEPITGPLSESMTAMELRKKMDTEYQLKPDMRFVEAAEYLQFIVADKNTDSAHLQWVQNQWEIRLGGDVIGTLPAYASFEQGLNFLDSWTRKLIETHDLRPTPSPGNQPLVSAGGDGFNPTALIENLTTLNSRWTDSSWNGGIIHEAALSLARLALVNRDFIQLGDMHNSRTMAVLTMAILINPNYNYREQKSQLAYTMGYTADAERFTTSLPQDNLWRGFINQNDKLLKSHLSSNQPGNEARYYWLLRLAQLGDSEKWIDHFSQYYLKELIPVHALLTGYELKRSNLYAYLFHTVPLVMLELAGGNRVWDQIADEIISFLPRDHQELAKPIIEKLKILLSPGLKTVLEKFDHKIATEKSNYKGPFLETRHWISYQNSLLFNSIYKHGTYSLDYFNNPANTNHIANQLLTSDSDTAKAIGQYLKTITLGSNNKATNREVLRTIGLVKKLGATPMFRLFDEIKNNFEYGSIEASEIVSKLVVSIDSRVDGRYDYANAMSLYLLNIGTAEQVYETIIQDSPANSLNVRAWRGFYFRDLESVYKLLDDPRLSYSDISYIAERYRGEDLTQSDLDKVYQKIISRFPNRLYLTRIYFEELEEKKRYQDARKVMLQWFDKYAEKSHENIRFRALIYISRSYRNEGQLEKANTVIQPTLNGSYGFGYYEATEIAIAEGRFEEASKIALTVRGRFPNSEFSFRNLIHAYWSNNQFTKAAKLVKAIGPFSHRFWRHDLGEIYAETFRENITGGVAAINALVEVKVSNIKVAELARAANENDLHELAFKSSNHLEYLGIGIFVYKLHAYKALKQWKGKKEALTWLESQYPEASRNSLSTIIYYQAEYDLLWDFITTPEKGTHPYGVWYIRAAAQVMGAGKDESRNRQLQEYYDNPDHDNFYDHLGRMALGLDSDEKLLNTTYNGKRLSEVSYYKGVFEYSQGRYKEAASWFRTAVETRVRINSEYRWAYGILYTWANRNIDLRTQIESSL